MTEKYHVPLALKSEEESKLLVSVSKEVVFVDALDKAFKSIPNLLKLKKKNLRVGAYASCKNWPSW